MTRFIHNHSILVSIAAAAALVLVVGVAGFGASPGAILAGLFCLGMMGPMLWMMSPWAPATATRAATRPPDN